MIYLDFLKNCYEIGCTIMASINEVYDKNGRKSWRARVRVSGFPPQSKTNSKKSIVTNWALDIENKIRTGKFLPELESRKHSVSDLIDRYLAKIAVTNKDQVKRKKSHLKRFKDDVGHLLLSNISKSDIVGVIEDLGSECTKKGTLRKQSTVARYVATFNHCFEYAVNDIEWTPTNPIKKITKPQESEPSTRFLDPEEFARLLVAAEKVKPILTRLILVLVFSGMRIGEALGIRVRDFDIGNNAILLSKTKNKEKRRVNIYGTAYNVLVEDIRKNSIRGKDWEPFGGNLNKNYQKYRRYLITAMKDAKVENFGFHGLRHTTASYHAMNGAQLQDICKILGHKSIKMANRYSHLMESHIKQKVQNLSENVINPLIKNTD